MPVEQPPGHDYRVNTDPVIKALLNDLGHKIGAQMPPGWGFGLFIFSFGEGGTMTWCSNAQRQDMLAALQEFIQAQGS